MSRIVFFCIPAHGHTNPTLGVVQELIARGHQVWYYSYEPMRQKIEATGAHFVSCDAFDAEKRVSPRDAARVGKDLAFSTKLLVDTTLALDDAVFRQMQQLRPDCIVADSMAVWGKAIAMKLGIPFVSSTTTFAFNQHSARIMKQSPGQILRMLLSLPKLTRETARLQEKGYPIHSFLDLIQNDNDIHTIVYTSRDFQPSADTFSDKYAFVGPSIRPAVTPIEKTHKKLVYISMGTVDNALLPLYRRCIEAFRDSDYQVILSTGGQVNPAALGNLPEQITAYPHLDQIAVLEQADVFITHCGMNSVSEALYYGVPLVLLPRTPEQRGVARRVLELGAGIQPRKTSAAALRAAVDQAVCNPTFRRQAELVSQGFRSSPGAKGAADKIEQVIAQNG